jgi:hypothetical protein
VAAGRARPPAVGGVDARAFSAGTRSRIRTGTGTGTGSRCRACAQAQDDTAQEHAGSAVACGEEDDRHEGRVQPSDAGEKDGVEEHLREEVRSHQGDGEENAGEEGVSEEDADEEDLDEEDLDEEGGQEGDRSLGLRPVPVVVGLGVVAAAAGAGP